jgi:hypothetical protein
VAHCVGWLVRLLVGPSVCPDNGVLWDLLTSGAGYVAIALRLGLGGHLVFFHCGLDWSCYVTLWSQSNGPVDTGGCVCFLFFLIWVLWGLGWVGYYGGCVFDF